MTNKTWMIAAALVSSFAAVGSASADGLNFSGSPNFGERRVSPGFTPDPIEISVTSGGSVNVSAQNLGQGCTGYASENPDFRFHLQGGQSSFLRFLVDAPGSDTTLVINTPNGQWRCNDDVSSSNRNPMIDFNNAPTGQYDIWIGSYRSGQNSRGTLKITELSSVRPGNNTASIEAEPSTVQFAGLGSSEKAILPPSRRSLLRAMRANVA